MNLNNKLNRSLIYSKITENWKNKINISRKIKKFLKKKK